jgi:hypothetical protein
MRHLEGPAWGLAPLIRRSHGEWGLSCPCVPRPSPRWAQPTESGRHLPSSSNPLRPAESRSPSCWRACLRRLLDGLEGGEGGLCSLRCSALVGCRRCSSSGGPPPSPPPGPSYLSLHPLRWRGVARRRLLAIGHTRAVPSPRVRRGGPRPPAPPLRPSGAVDDACRGAGALSLSNRIVDHFLSAVLLSSSAAPEASDILSLISALAGCSARLPGPSPRERRLSLEAPLHASSVGPVPDGGRVPVSLGSAGAPAARGGRSAHLRAAAAAEPVCRGEDQGRPQALHRLPQRHGLLTPAARRSARPAPCARWTGAGPGQEAPQAPADAGLG